MGTQNKTQKWSQYFCDCLCPPTLVNNDLLFGAAPLVQPLRFDTNIRCSGFPLWAVGPDKWNLRQDWDHFLVLSSLFSVLELLPLMLWNFISSCLEDPRHKAKRLSPLQVPGRCTPRQDTSPKGWHCPPQLSAPWWLSESIKGVTRSQSGVSPGLEVHDYE